MPVVPRAQKKKESAELHRLGTVLVSPSRSLGNPIATRKNGAKGPNRSRLRQQPDRSQSWRRRTSTLIVGRRRTSAQRRSGNSRITITNSSAPASISILNTANGIPKVSATKSRQYQNSVREARPEDWLYSEKQRPIASPMLEGIGGAATGSIFSYLADMSAGTPMSAPQDGQKEQFSGIVWLQRGQFISKSFHIYNLFTLYHP